jgi:glycosyltransferase involved in cell wall biosynthesis
MEKVSAVIIAYNEQDTIERCLKGLDWADEIIVVDSFSSDQTVERCQRYTAKVIRHEWEGFVRQKIYATGLAQHDWIFSIDADEELSVELKADIINLKRSGFNAAAYQIPRRVFYLGKWIGHGGWYPDYKVRLFNRQQGQWIGIDVHEYWQTTGRLGKVRGDLLHYSYKNVADHVRKINQTTSVSAQELLSQGIRVSPFHTLIKPTAKFLKSYFIKAGFLDGYIGLVIALMGGYYVFLKYLKAWELQKHTGH